jgi:ferredoxin-NADP reductase
MATVVASTPLTPTIKSVCLELDVQDFQFLPGQAVWPKFERDGKSFTKIYSIASSPTRSPIIELCISRVGWSSAYMQDLEPGDQIPVRGPYGMMTLSELPPRPRLYIAEGSGIAPIKSHIEWLAQQRFNRPVWLVQANPETPDCLPYQDMWRSLQQTWAMFHYVEVLDAVPEALLSQIISMPDKLDVDICAVGDRVTDLRAAVKHLGVSPRAIRTEKFVAF